MGEEYEEIERTEAKISEWLKALFLKERLLFAEMLELILESFKSIGARRQDTAADELALLTLATRMFNDAEGAKQLLLWGLPDQAQPVIRDIIECLLLFRLFLKRPETAEKWLMNLAQYQPGAVNAELLKSGIDAKEYSLYGVLSHDAHANLLASLSHVQEIDGGAQGILRRAHFGSASTPETEYFVQHNFLMLFFLMHVALMEPLAELYYRHSEADAFEIWYGKVDNLLPKLEDLASEMSAKPTFGASEVDDATVKLVMKKMRFEEFKRRLAGDADVP